MKILGIDLAGSQKRKTGICFLIPQKKNQKNINFKAKTFSVFSDQEILDWIEKEKPKLIAIDAPLSLPHGRNDLKRPAKIHFRKCDKELWRLGIKFFPITLGPMRKLTERGMMLKEKLKNRFQVIEVYPGATQDLLGIPRKQYGLLRLKRGLEKLGIKITNKKINGDELDAITAAYTGWLYLKNKCLRIGDSREGQIILPNSFLNFLNCQIDVSRRVFKPRIETAFCLKKVLNSLKKISGKIKVLDMFSGSGCIGVATLKNLKNSIVHFVDIDKKAIEQIKINLKINNIKKTRYKIFCSNLFEKLNNRKYNIIFANPPYVAKERLFEIQESVKKEEPKISWYGGKEGMVIIKKFLKEAKRFLEPNGIIYLEFDPFQKEKIEKILKKEGYSGFQFFKDQFQKFRWVKILK